MTHIETSPSDTLKIHFTALIRLNLCDNEVLRSLAGPWQSETPGEHLHFVVREKTEE
jgi:hypothetical protein